MCGRYVSPEQAAIEHEWPIGRANSNPFPRVFNVAPTTLVPILRLDRESDELELTAARWGLIPHWWKDNKLPAHTINARSEDAPTKPMWRTALRNWRCLIPAEGWYEWVRHEVACVIVRRARSDRTCHPIGSTLRGMAIRKRIV
jgi:putative SOS response-associated peptidase YedK